MLWRRSLRAATSALLKLRANRIWCPPATQWSLKGCGFTPTRNEYVKLDRKN
jgi:hypothetical protein